ncbi:MAG: O-antigen ligase family protein [Mycobacteriales bacterium]|nr:O-antigen ligase family protein [Mycobacteriales bacterium]
MPAAIDSARRSSDAQDAAALRLVPGTVVVAFLLTCGRWGSYFGLPSRAVYITDVLLVGTVVWLLSQHRAWLRARWAVLRSGWRPLLPLGALLAWCLLRLAAGGLPDRSGLRDVAPYLYACVALFPFLAGREVDWGRTSQVLRAALLAHLGWVTVSKYVGALTASMPLLGGKVRIFEIRADFDGAVLAITAGVFLARALVAFRSWQGALAAACGVWSSLLVLQVANRAAVLALIVVLGILFADRRRSLLRLPRTVVLPSAAVLLVLALVLVPRTAIYGRLSGDAEFSGNAASGTTDARVEAWTDVLRYMQSSPSRVVAGVGFGTDFLGASGGDERFEGTTFKDVRAPHNYVLNTYARLGLVGVGLLAWTLAALAAAARQLLRRGRRVRDVDLLLVFTVGSLLVASLVGVILESPFGAVPFFWAVGALLVQRAGPEAPHKLTAKVVEELREPLDPRPGPPPEMRPAVPLVWTRLSPSTFVVTAGAPQRDND